MQLKTFDNREIQKVHIFRNMSVDTQNGSPWTKKYSQNIYNGQNKHQQIYLKRYYINVIIDKLYTIRIMYMRHTIHHTPIKYKWKTSNNKKV